MHGFQLWANLPSSLKMTAPRYQDVVAKDIPEVIDDDGTRVRVICGDFAGKTGPIDGVAAEPRYLDISVPPGRRKRLAVYTAHHAFPYFFRGSGAFRDAAGAHAGHTKPVRTSGKRCTTAAAARTTRRAAGRFVWCIPKCADPKGRR